MLHKKDNHPENIPICDKFIQDQCFKSEKDCWFEHPKTRIQSQKSPPKSKCNSPTRVTPKKDFHEAARNPPPDHVQALLVIVNRLCNKVEKMEKRLEEVLE